MSPSPHTTDAEVAASFWRSIQPGDPSTGRSRQPMGAAANLCELFEQKLALLVAGASEADRVARRLFTALGHDQIAARRLALGLAKSARACLPALPHALWSEGLVLRPTRDVVVHVLLMPINPARPGPYILEPKGVAGARMVDALTHVALHFETEAEHAAEDARLLGSDGLHRALAGWAGIWRECRNDLRRCARTIRMEAYAAEVEAPPHWQTA